VRGNVLIHREVSPFSSGGLAQRIARKASHSVYDFDDALAWLDVTLKEKIWSKREACAVSVSSCDVVIAGNEVLAEWASEYSRDVRVIPTCVDHERYLNKTDYSLGEIPSMVWLGSSSTERYLELVAPALRIVHRETGARLTVISAPGAGARNEALRDFTDFIDWTPGIEFELGKYDLAISPLANGQVERGKCAYKTLQYAAAGLPIVGSPISANATALNSLGQTAAATQREWRDAICDYLRASIAERRARGQEGRKGVETGYSYAAWSQAWLRTVLPDDGQ
jgi:glycosyltransferase involved in cell wall biosynthesis